MNNESIPIRDLLRSVASEPTPCDDCWNFQKCATQQLSCGDFFLWVAHKRVTCEQRIPSRLWELRLQRADDEESSEDFTTESLEHYWSGVRDGISIRRDPQTRDRVRDAGLASRIVFEDQLAYLCGIRDADDNKLTNLARWREMNKSPGVKNDTAKRIQLGIDRVAGLVPNPQTPAEKTAVKIANSIGKQAVFLEPDKTITIVDAAHVMTDRRIKRDPRSLIGVYAPSCPPEWIVEDIERVVR
jgi:hypothetical protein